MLESFKKKLHKHPCLHSDSETKALQTAVNSRGRNPMYTIYTIVQPSGFQRSCTKAAQLETYAFPGVFWAHTPNTLFRRRLPVAVPLGRKHRSAGVGGGCGEKEAVRQRQRKEMRLPLRERWCSWQPGQKPNRIPVAKSRPRTPSSRPAPQANLSSSHPAPARCYRCYQRGS